MYYFPEQMTYYEVTEGQVSSQRQTYLQNTSK